MDRNLFKMLLKHSIHASISSTNHILMPFYEADMPSDLKFRLMAPYRHLLENENPFLRGCTNAIFMILETPDGVSVNRFNAELKDRLINNLINGMEDAITKLQDHAKQAHNYDQLIQIGCEFIDEQIEEIVDKFDESTDHEILI